MGDDLAPLLRADLRRPEAEGVGGGREPLRPGRPHVALRVLALHPQGEGDHTDHLAGGLLEGQIDEATLHLRPLDPARCAGVERVALESLVQDRHDQHRRLAAARGRLGEALEHEQVALLVLARGVVEELAELVDQHEHALEMPLGVQEPCRLRYQIRDACRIKREVVRVRVEIPAQLIKLRRLQP